jgi:hypothetical protein
MMLRIGASTVRVMSNLPANTPGIGIICRVRYVRITRTAGSPSGPATAQEVTANG